MVSPRSSRHSLQASLVPLYDPRIVNDSEPTVITPPPSSSSRALFLAHVFFHWVARLSQPHPGITTALMIYCLF